MRCSSSVDIGWSKKAETMPLLPLLFVPLLALYAVLGLIVFRQASKPSCRVCALRGLCPNRLRGRDQFTKLPACTRRDCPTASGVGTSL
jgi:hypothetical protein